MAEAELCRAFSACFTVRSAGAAGADFAAKKTLLDSGASFPDSLVPAPFLSSLFHEKPIEIPG
ncbi:hypothetical protein I2I05_02895 [Hymenobacter sp. BT683]|uniref:Uncharacterized protein n=1 Tax=Hymenobacter jeongseonensis TaxID=2791027 RepID=A0ABS0IDA2_9BACT|nr:hypothetical protein [Hymenobacter jeongseonensis]MBF9236334.1 hypothetical protein [Hymenobacter jeongseonensis]